MRTLVRWALTPLAVMALASCGDGDNKVEPVAAEPTNQTLAAAVKGDAAFDTLEGVLANAGLTDVLEGKGPYTVFAPADAAFTASGGDFTDEALRAQGAALLRAHIVPGALTRQDIAAALDRAGGSVEMRTMADGLLTFSRDGEVIIVTAADGAQGRLTGGETVASNGVLQPVDGLLVKTTAPAA